MIALRRYRSDDALMSASVKELLQGAHHVVGDHVGGGVHRERVEAARGVREVEQRARALGRHEAHRSLRGVALGVEHHHRAALAAQVLRDRGHQVARLALLHRARHCGVLAAHWGDESRPGRARRAAAPPRCGGAGSRAARGPAAARRGRTARWRTPPRGGATARRAQWRRTPPCAREARGLPSPRATRLA